MTLTADAPTAVAASRPGRRAPLGATPLAGGTNFAVASEAADGMVLCLFVHFAIAVQHPPHGGYAGE